MGKSRINLLQPELLPQKQALTLTRVVQAWAVMSVVLIAVIYQLDSQLAQSQQSADTLRQAGTLNQSKITELEQQVINQLEDPQLQAQLRMLKSRFNSKQKLQTQLANEQRQFATGFSGYMTELARYHQANISLQEVMISAAEVSFSGQASQADAVPYWLSGLAQSQYLSGKEFATLLLDTKDDGEILFNVSSVIKLPAKEVANEQVQ